jgi:hypothetical protein
LPELLSQIIEHLVFSPDDWLDVTARTVTVSLAHIERPSVSQRAKSIVSSERSRQSGKLEPSQKSPKIEASKFRQDIGYELN